MGYGEVNKKVSLCMIVKNEEINIARCLNSVVNAVDEIIVVDTGSSDLTKQIAEKAGAKVISFPWHDDFSAARNASLELATGKWILFLDADEELEPGSSQAIRQVAENDNEGYFIKIVNFIGEEGSIESCPDLVFRMFRNKPEYRFRGAIHEQIIDVILSVNEQARFQIAPNVIIRHYGYLNRQIIAKDKKNRNLAIIRKELENQPNNNTLRYHYGVELYRTNSFREAIQELVGVESTTDPGTIYYPKLLRYIALAYYGTKQNDKALEAIYRGLKLFPDYADLYFYGGIIQLEQNNYAGAFEFFNQALKTPEQPAHYAPFDGSRGFRTYYQMGRMAEIFGNQEEALRYYILSLQDNANFTIAISAIVHILNPLEDPEYTRKAMEKLCDFCTMDAKRLIGTVYFSERAYSLALNYFDKLDLSRLDEYTRMLKAICLIQQNRIFEARHILSTFTPSNPQFALARINEILCYWFNKNSKKVSTLCENFLALGLSPDTGAVVTILKESLYKRSSAPPVVLGSEGMSLVTDIVARALDRKDCQLADSLLKKVAEASQTEAGLILARVFACYKYWDTAKYYVKLYLKKDTENAEAWCHLGEILQNIQQPEEAVLCYRQALTIAPKQPQYYVKLIKFYQAMRLKLLTEAVRNYPDIAIFKQLLEEASEDERTESCSGNDSEK